MIVYKAVNSANGMVYVGITRRSLAKRMSDHKNQAAATRSQSAFHAAIREFGWDAFEWTVLQTCSSFDELQQAERNHIATQNAKCLGYNRTNGGNGTAGYVFTAEAKAKLALARSDTYLRKYGLKKQKRLFSHRVGRPLTEQHKANISASLKAADHASRPRKLNLADYPAIRDRRERGESFRRIAADYLVRPETVFYFCKREGGRA